MYKIPMNKRGLIQRNITVEGETIEIKMKRILSNKEPIKDGADEIFTERKAGVMAAYNIRTDRWELAAEAMDYVERSRIAKRDEALKSDETKIIDMKGKNVGKPESTPGKTGSGADQ